ncbi:protein phosphatase CheZ [Gimibacter soli]|uniref:Protein phosphatase CheZ n=1 Tax=Gimibacter soli TaxID=3024400 RepID=A0AAE9XS63_9PROT|nr:protein phosphatase CheZ [Gimibacter soli]WCL53030.1 protein phosphatase CheZ [Gimibacter soli]
MTKEAKPVSLESRAEALRQDRGDNVAIAEISSVVGSLMSGTVVDDELDEIATELRELTLFIGAAKHVLSDLGPKNLSNRSIPDAAEQLDAIVEATDAAATSIMDVAETLEGMAEDTDGDISATLGNLAITLFEASSFQDLTGQRVTKVARILQHMEERLNKLADAIGDTHIEEAAAEAEIEKDDEGVAVNDKDLLHGPQLEGQGNSQDEIDAILAMFD